jgi:hypothetical protein
VTVGTTDYEFDFTNQEIGVEDGVLTSSADDIKEAIRKAESSQNGIVFPSFLNTANPVTLDVAQGSSTFLTCTLLFLWRIVSLSTSGTFTLGGGNIVQVATGVDVLGVNVLVNQINNTSQAGVLITVASGSGLSPAQDDLLTDIGNRTTFHSKIINNYRELRKIGAVWYLVVYDDGEVSGGTEILRKAMKDDDGNNITDLLAGVMSDELANTA